MKMFRVGQIVKDWKESGTLQAHVSLYGFWDEQTFLTKSGDLGMVLQVKGIDYESLDSTGQDQAVKRLEAALRTLDPRVRVYQALFKASHQAIPHQQYANPLVRAAIDQRMAYFAARADQLFSIDLFLIVLIQGAYAQSTLWHVLQKASRDIGGALQEAIALFSKDERRVFLGEQIERDHQLLRQKVMSLTGQLSDLVEIQLLGAEEAFRTLRRFINFGPSKIRNSRLHGSRYLDFQLCDSEIEAHRGFLRLDDYYVKVLTLKELPGETRPLILKELFEIKTNFHVITEWRAIDNAKARKQIASRRRHYHNSKTSFLSNLEDKQNQGPKDDLVDDSKQAAIEELGECLKAIGNDGKYFGEFTLSVVIYDEELTRVREAIPEFQKVFTTHDGLLHEERYNLLNAFFATIPGNYAFNLRKQEMLNTNYADLSFLFTIDSGKQRNQHLNREYLAVLETDHATPYYLNLHDQDVAHTLILGYTGSGKSFLLNFLIQNLQKYDPLTYIFDLGGSYESLTEVFGGSYLNVGLESRTFVINPFCLEPTRENLNFLYLFAKVLIEASGKYELTSQDEKGLYAGVERMYKLGPESRTLTNFASMLGPLGERLHRWTRAGQFGYVFDNAEDTLTFSRFQTFNFDGMDQYPDVLEPLLFYILHRASNQIEDAGLTATFKAFVLDEAWIFLRNRTVRDYITRAEKTWRKRNAAMILATQSVHELVQSDMLPVVNECCATKIFLANPSIDHKLYADLFHLNDTELDLLSSLVPKRDLLIKQHNASKKVRLNVDSLSYWMATNNPKDNVRKREYLARHGVVEGLSLLAKEFPFDLQNS
jgi:type IV secretion/conjugal transfer VirB4 family ATPase